MKIHASGKLIITSLAIVFFSILSGLIVNLLTSDNNFNQWLKDNSIGTGKLITGVILSGIALLFFTYFQLRYSQQNEKSTEKENLSENSEADVKRYYDSLKERYRKRYESKLDGRFEITLEVSENWDGDNTKNFKGEYEGKGQISEAFEYINSAFEKHGRLLIVGSPGVGKTVLLLKLALELLKKADVEKKEAFPVIFNLASWSDDYENFDDWLISVLNSGEGLSKDFAGKLLQDERIVFLLDGLDELARNENEKAAAKKRARCLQSLNEYLDRGKKAVICCRVNEFELIQTLTGKDAPVSAKVKVNDLSEAEILNTLMKVQNHKNDGIAANNLLNTLNKDENNELLKVLSTPFYFTAALEVFDKQIFDEADLPKAPPDLKNYLRKKFIEKKLNITLNPNNFNNEKTQRWLQWLAHLIDKKQQVVFELADLQPNDLTNDNKYSFLVGLVTGLISFLFFVLISSFLFCESFIIYVCLFISFLEGVASSARYGSEKIKTSDFIQINFPKKFSWDQWISDLKAQLRVSCFLGSLPGILLGILYGIKYEDIIVGIGVGVMIFILVSLFWFFILFFLTSMSNFLSYKEKSRISQLKESYQRLLLAFNVNVVFYILLLFLLFGGLLISILFLKGQYLAIQSIVIFLLVIISSTVMISIALFRHLLLRLCFYYEDKMPLKYATFLDYAAEARILEKDGGHWRFRHQNLQDYFAGLDEQSESPVSNANIPMSNEKVR